MGFNQFSFANTTQCFQALCNWKVMAIKLQSLIDFHFKRIDFHWNIHFQLCRYYSLNDCLSRAIDIKTFESYTYLCHLWSWTYIWIQSFRKIALNFLLVIFCSLWYIKSVKCVAKNRLHKRRLQTLILKFTQNQPNC